MVSVVDKVITSELVKIGKRDDTFNLKQDEKEAIIVHMKEEV